MLALTDIQTRKSIQVAEGYLDLATGMGSPLELKSSLRTMLCERAISTLDSIESPTKKRAYVLFLKGQARRIQSRFVEAIAYFEKAYELDLSDPHVCLGLAYCYKRLERYDLAIKSVEKAIELDPENPMSHFNLACYSALSGQESVAILHLSFAIDLDATYRNKISGEADFDTLRHHPLFESLTKQLV